MTHEKCEKLEDLPNELLLELVDHLPPANEDRLPRKTNELLALARTSKRLHEFATGVLYRHIHLSHEDITG